MTLKPKDYIAERRREINRQIEELKLEMEQLNRMESALSPDLFTSPAKPTTVLGSPVPKKRRRVAGGIKTLVLEVLARKADGLTAQDILREIKAQFDVDLPRTSLSPQLTRLKTEGKVEAEHSVWKITPDGIGDAF